MPRLQIYRHFLMHGENLLTQSGDLLFLRNIKSKIDFDTTAIKKLLYNTLPSMQVSHIRPKGIELHVVSILIFKLLLCVSISHLSNHLLAG
jgi:hypothetical protein